jgi:hypothetical protein
MLKELKTREVDIILGSRFIGPSPTNIPTIKHLLLKAAVLFTKATTGLKLTDTHNGLRVFNRRVAESINLRLRGMSHASEFLSKVSRFNYSYDEYPTVIKYTQYSVSKGQSIINLVNIVFDLVVDSLRR